MTHFTIIMSKDRNIPGLFLHYVTTKVKLFLKLIPEGSLVKNYIKKFNLIFVFYLYKSQYKLYSSSSTN